MRGCERLTLLTLACFVTAFGYVSLGPFPRILRSRMYSSRNTKGMVLMSDDLRSQLPDPETLAFKTLDQCAPLSDVFGASIKGKVAIVTGGATGLGFNVVNRLAEAGCRVVIACRNETRGTAAVDVLRQRGYDVSYCQTDVMKVDDCYAAVDFAVKTYGNVDILVNDAAVWDEMAYLDVTEQVWDRVIDTDLKGSYFMGQAVARNMVANKTKGKIVFISSAARLGECIRSLGMLSFYQAAKAGVAGMIADIAGELKQYGINVNCVAPGGMLTHGCFFEGWENQAKYGDEYKEIKNAHAYDTPLAYNPDAVALTVFAMCTPMSDYMNGSIVDVNGGALLITQSKPFSINVEGCIPGPQA